jgi:hypothetical protein
MKSPLWKSAIQYARAKDGNFYRVAGGYWYFDKYRNSQYVGTTTVEAIVKRGIATYTEWKQGRFRTFPVKATLNFNERLF